MSNLRVLILGIVATLLVLIFSIKQISGVVIECKNNFDTKKAKIATVEDLRKKEETIRIANDRLQQEQDVLKPFYKPEFPTADAISAFGGMFEDMIDYIRMNGLMLRSIEYNINPDQDLIFKNFSSTYNVCEVKLFLIGTYPQLQSFFRDINLYPYYLNISKVYIKPHDTKKQYLLINLSITLYSKK